MSRYILLLFLLLVFTSAAAQNVYPLFPETFETATKTAYAPAEVKLTTGNWLLNDALLGNSTNDHKIGNKSVRMQQNGSLAMRFDVADGASEVRILHAVYGTDAPSIWELWYSQNEGNSWVKTGETAHTTSTHLTQIQFRLSLNGKVRFQIRKLGGGRLNIDNITIIDNLPDSPTRDDNLALGNPSNATIDHNNPNNFLIVKPQYALSYNNSRGTANWVSWHLSAAWKGAAARCDCFTRDSTLTPTFFSATTYNYTNTGFDRGHLCPSDDRDQTQDDNASTFRMTNIIPQAPKCNQRTWKYLEDYCRKLVNEGNELYIISGAYGFGGTGNKGGITTTIANGKIAVPSRVWKVIVVLPVGNNDLGRINESTRVIAVDMPNKQIVSEHKWEFYRTSVDAIEFETGLDILSSVPVNIQKVIEARKDTLTIQ